MNENENTRQQCLGDTLKADLRAKFMPLIAYKKNHSWFNYPKERKR